MPNNNLLQQFHLQTIAAARKSTIVGPMECRKIRFTPANYAEPENRATKMMPPYSTSKAAIIHSAFLVTTPRKGGSLLIEK